MIAAVRARTPRGAAAGAGRRVERRRGRRRASPARSCGSRRAGCARTGRRFEVAAGEPWDPLVARWVGAGLAGVECLAGIPGSVGATPIQNVGAYGQEVAETIVSRARYDRTLRDGARGPGGRVRVLLPLERVQARPGPLGRARGHVRARARGRLAAGALRRAGARARDRRGGAGAARRRARGGAGAAPPQGDGDRPGRSRLGLAPARSSPTRCSAPPRSRSSRSAPASGSATRPACRASRRRTAA